MTREDKVKQVLDEILEKLPEEFNMSEIMGKVEERTPYVIVAFQECERMNFLTSEIKRSLKELDLGLKVYKAIKMQLNPMSKVSSSTGRTDDNQRHGAIGEFLVPRSGSGNLGSESLSISAGFVIMVH